MEPNGVVKLIDRSEHKIKGGHYLWNAVCFCGTHFLVLKSNITNGSTKSCGCWRRLNPSLRFKGKIGPRALPDPTEAAFNRLFYRYRKSAKERGYVFELDKTIFRTIVEQNCHYCGATPVPGCTEMRTRVPYAHNGVDRKDNHIGYTHANALPYCASCNYLKKAQAYDEFLDHIKRIALYVLKL